MAFRDRDTLLGIPTLPLPLAAGDTPGGYPAGTRFVDNGEPAEGERFNRGFAALAENTDDLDTRVTREIAVPLVGVLTLGAPAGSFTIGSGGDIDITAGSPAYEDLFMGSAGWAVNQESRDKLFEILDSDYNEVIVDGNEVKAASFVGAAIADAFVDVTGGTVTVTLNETMPAGSYRIGFFADSTVATLDEAVFASVAVRGLQESPAESQQKAMWVCAPTGGGPADYVGDTAVADAMADHPGGTIFVKNGTYAHGAGNLTIPTNTTVIGESANGVVFEFEPGDDCTIQNRALVQSVTLKQTGVLATATTVGLSGNFAAMRDCIVEDMDVSLTGDNSLIDGLNHTPYDAGIAFASGDYSTVRRVLMNAPTLDDNTKYMLIVASTDGARLENIELSTASQDQNGLQLVGTNVELKISGLKMSIGGAGAGVVLGGAVNRSTISDFLVDCTAGLALWINSTIGSLTFEDGEFRSNEQIVETSDGATYTEMGITFRRVDFDNTGSAWYEAPAVRILSTRNFQAVDDYSSFRPTFENCVFEDRYSKGAYKSGGLPAPGTPGIPDSTFPVFHIAGASMKDVRFERNGITHIIWDSPWIYLDQCVVDRMLVHWGVDIIAADFIYNSIDAEGLMEFWNGTRVTDLVVGANAFQGDWSCGLVYMESPMYGDTTNDFHRQGILDGLHLLTVTGYAMTWTMASSFRGLLVRGVGDVIIRRVIWDPTCGTASAGTPTHALIRTWGTVEDCQFYADETAAVKTVVTRFIELMGDHSCVRRCRMYSKPNSGVEEFFYFIDLGTGADSCIIEDNFMIYDGNTVLARYMIHASGQYFPKICNNQLFVTGDAVAEPLLIDLRDTGVGSYGTVIGNALQTYGGSTAPDINPNTVVGYATNVLVFNGSLAPPAY